MLLHKMGAWHWFRLTFSNKILKVSFGGELEIRTPKTRPLLQSWVPC